MLLGDGWILQAFLKIGIDNLDAVQRDCNVPPLRADGHAVPLTCRLAGPASGRDDVVDGAGVLVEINLSVIGMKVVENLDLDADPANVSLHWGADVDAAVAAGLDAVIESNLEIGIVALRSQPAASTALANEDALLHGPNIILTGEPLPASEILAVEKRYEAGFNGTNFLRRTEGGRQAKDCECEIHGVILLTARSVEPFYERRLPTC